MADDSGGLDPAGLRDRWRAIRAVGRFARAAPIEAWELEALAEAEALAVRGGEAAEAEIPADPLQLSLGLGDLVPDLNVFVRVGERRDDPRDLWWPAAAASSRWPFLDMDTPTSANVIALEVPDRERVAAAVETGDIPPPRWLIGGLV